jgi:hypothetical protein
VSQVPFFAASGPSVILEHIFRKSHQAIYSYPELHVIFLFAQLAEVVAGLGHSGTANRMRKMPESPSGEEARWILGIIDCEFNLKTFEFRSVDKLWGNQSDAD